MKTSRMNTFPVPVNEARRLKVLWEYEVLDSVPEEIFDDLTELAATICEAPMALISLVDKTRQWFKARLGLETIETSRDASFCSHAIMQPDLLIVPDATKDARFKDNPLVLEEPKIRFYAGAPMITPDGHALGTLCILDTEPRDLSASQRKALRVLAHLVVSQLELRRHAKELAKAREDTQLLKQELEKAHAHLGDLQRARIAP
jgi:GAF domain-containing protein